MRRVALLSLLAVLGGLIAAGHTRPAPAPPPLRAAAGGLTAAGHRRPARAAPPADRPRVKLAVLVVFDQMRGDFLDKWQPLFGEGGFARLQADGAWFTACYYPYGTTTTGP